MKTNGILLLLAIMLFMTACSRNKTSDDDLQSSFVYDKVVPVDFPKLNIPGFHFPEDSNTLNKWIYNNDTAQIYKHGWGIWTGLTSPTSQKAGGKTLLVYETWMTPEEMIDSILQKPVLRSNRTNLKMPHQLTHFGHTVNDSIHESVSYSPGSAAFAMQNKIFLATTLAGYAKQGMTEIPTFPNDAINIKPVFKILPAVSKKGQTKFAIATWHGPTDSLISYPEKAWKTIVYVDVNNQGKGNGEQLKVTKIGQTPPPTPETTYNLDEFIHYTMNAEDAHYFNKEFSENQGNPMTAKPGDIVILVGMHVTSRENTRWTWQTFWWAPDPLNPPAPSSKAVAAHKPKALKGAPAHYAMAITYYMVNPKEPYNGTNVIGKPNYVFNPYLESGFGPNVFDTSRSYVNTAPNKKVPTYVGDRTNCMSCHVMATVDPTKLNSSNNANTPYIGNAYVGLNDPIFKNQLKLDFAWSIQGNVDTTGLKAYLLNNK